MIVQCTTNNVTMLIEKVKQRQLAYLKVEKKDNELIMDYSLVSDLEENKKIQAENVLQDSLKTTFDFLKRLDELKALVTKEIIPTSYSLCYDCTKNSSQPIFTVRSIIPNGIFESMPAKKEIVVNWDEVFKDKENDIVPDLYCKKSSKKYAPVTYKELAEMLRN